MYSVAIFCGKYLFILRHCSHIHGSVLSKYHRKSVLNSYFACVYSVSLNENEDGRGDRDYAALSKYSPPYLLNAA